MRKVRKNKKLPIDSIIIKNFSGKIQYIDSLSIDIENKIKYTVDYLTALVFTSIPNWSKILFKIRNIAVKPFGLEAGSIPDLNNISLTVRYDIGDRAIFFHVVDRSNSEIVMAEDDKHLYFRISLLTKESTKPGYQTIYLTTIVQFHNILGKIYFVPVKPFHKLIVKRLLLNFSEKIAEKNRF